MSPQTVQKLKEEREFIAFMKENIKVLDSLQGLNFMSSDERAVEVTARMRAKDVLENILSPFLDDAHDGPVPVDGSEFAVDVE